MSEPIHGELLEVPPAGSRRRESFDDFYAAELPRLVALARGLCGAALAEDVAQEAMLVAYRRWREVGGLERPEQWVRRTCANLAVSQFRRRMVELRVKARLSVRRPAADELDEASEEFWSAVRALPHRQAQAAGLRFVYDMPIADIARTLGCSEGTVKQHLSRARRSLAAGSGHRERGGVMRLDDLAREATASLVSDTTPNTVTGLADLKGTNRRRTSARAVGTGVAVAALIGGWFAITADGSGEPEPAAPVVRNGALLVQLDAGLHKVDGGGPPLDLPVDQDRFSELSFTADGSELVYTTNGAVIVGHDVASGATRELWECPHPSLCSGSASPDGQRLAVPVDEGIEVHRVDGEGVDLLATPEPPAPYVAWSPDGETVGVLPPPGGSRRHWPANVAGARLLLLHRNLAT